MSQVLLSVPTGTAFCKPGQKCVHNVPFRDTGTSRSKPGLSRSNRDVWSAWCRCTCVRRWCVWMITLRCVRFHHYGLYGFGGYFATLAIMFILMEMTRGLNTQKARTQCHRLNYEHMLVTYSQLTQQNWQKTWKSAIAYNLWRNYPHVRIRFLT